MIIVPEHLLTEILAELAQGKKLKEGDGVSTWRDLPHVELKSGGDT